MGYDPRGAWERQVGAECCTFRPDLGPIPVKQYGYQERMARPHCSYVPCGPACEFWVDPGGLAFLSASECRPGSPDALSAFGTYQLPWLDGCLPPPSVVGTPLCVAPVLPVRMMGGRVFRPILISLHPLFKAYSTRLSPRSCVPTVLSALVAGQAPLLRLSVDSFPRAPVLMRRQSGRWQKLNAG